MLATVFLEYVLDFCWDQGYRGNLFPLTLLFIIGFIAPLALIIILFLYRKLFFTVYKYCLFSFAFKSNKCIIAIMIIKTTTIIIMIIIIIIIIVLMMMMFGPPMTTGLARKSAVQTSRMYLFQSATVILLMPTSCLQNSIINSLL